MTRLPVPAAEGSSLSEVRNEGARLLDDVVATLRRYLVLPPHAPEAIALWTAHTYAVEAFYFSPRLVLTSAVMRCGKSTTLSLISNLACQSVMVSSATSSSIFRVMDERTPTLLLDEADGWLLGDQGIRTVLNGGFSRSTATVLRTDMNSFQPTEFDAFGPMALALIGEPDATVLDRSVVIRLRRKTRRDRVDRLRGATAAEQMRPLCERLAAWVPLAAADASREPPELPDGLDDRACDLWEPLLTLADAAGGDWPDRARAAALNLSAQRLQGESDMRLRLLEDLRVVLEGLGGDRFPTRLLLRKLVGVEGSPWSDWQHGRPLTSRALADLLRPFHLTPITIRLQDGTTPKGYKREDVEHLFELYLDPRESATPPQDGS